MERPPLEPITSAVQYHQYLDEIALLMAKDPERGTPEGERLDALADLIEAYEKKHFPLNL